MGSMGQKFRNYEQQQQQTKRLRFVGNVGLSLLTAAALAILLWVFVLG
jgi:hypothetical protein